MNYYSVGRREALETFFKAADYASNLADVWEKVQPAKAPLGARMAGGAVGGLLGGAGGGVATLEPTDIASFLEWNKGTGGGLGGALKGLGSAGLKSTLSGAPEGLSGAIGGAGVGSNAVKMLHRKMTHMGRAHSIRKYAPKAAMGLGATALAAGLASHLLSGGDRE